MTINTSVYGAADTWINSWFLSTGRMKAKCANFNGGNNLVTSSTLGAGHTANKTPHDTLIDRSICTNALGTESLYCHINYVYGTSGGAVTNVYTDDTQVTEFFYCENDRQDQLGDRQLQIDSRSKSDMWKTYATPDPVNFSDRTIPITELNPKKILYILQVLPCNATGSTGSWIILGDYHNNANSVRSDYPYISAARLTPRIDNSNSETPSRVAFTDATSSFGIAINRELTNSNNSAWKINYTLFRNVTENNGIWLYGYARQPFDYFPAIDDSPVVLLGDKNDITQIGSNTYFMHQYTDDFKEFLIRQAACFGVYFRVESTGGPVGSLPLDNPAVYLGLLDDQGIGHGEYTSGADNVNNPIWQWDNYSQSPYDYTKPIDPTPYNKQTVFGSNGLINTFIQYWALSPAALTGLCDKIYNYIDGLDPDTVDINQSITKTFYTNNPLDVIVSLKRLPFDITQYSSITGTAQPVKLGNLSLFDITGYKLNGQYTVVDFGSYHVYPKFGNTFLDYAPYTYFELIIPFCGSTRIDPALFMDKTLKLKMVVDLYTGACTCYILADNLCIDSVSGNCAIDIPVSGIQSADFQNSVQNAITNVKNARINSKAFNMRGGLAMGMIWRGNTHANMGTDKFAAVGNALANIGSSLSSALNIGSNITSVQQQEAQNAIDVNQAEYNLQHVQTPFNSVGSQSASNSYVEEMQARLIIYRPKFADGFDAAKYAKTIGHACLINGKVSDFSGLTVGNINTDGIVLGGMSPTDTEKSMLKSLFAGGVYL